MSDYDEMVERKLVSDREATLQHGNVQYRPGPRQAHANVPHGAGPVGANLSEAAPVSQQSLFAIYEELSALNSRIGGCLDHIHGIANRLMGEPHNEEARAPKGPGFAVGVSGISGAIASEVAGLQTRIDVLQEQIERFERL